MLREADRSSVAEVAKKNKVSKQGIYGWRKHFNGPDPQDIKRSKTLKVENTKLMKLLAVIPQKSKTGAEAPASYVPART
jgi:putative transposase